MIPNVTVPMNFGRNLLTSPTHNNLILNTSEGGEVRASSVILSFNSPVIGHMTGELHMTSVDMMEFTEDAVRVFLDAAYSGSAEAITRTVFRDVSKISNVFEVNWLVGQCVEFFRRLADSMKTGNYTDLLFLFEEAAYLFEIGKNRQLVSLALKKIKELKWEQEFIDQYLENADRLSTKKLDLVIELAGSEVNFIVQNLTTQLSEQVRAQSSFIPISSRYLLGNADLYLCRESYRELFDQLFNILEEHAPDKESMRWVLHLLKKSEYKKGASSSFAPVTGSAVTCVTRCYDIPNLYHEFDMNCSLNQLLEWLSTSDVVNNVFMAVEAVQTWVLNKKFIDDNTSLRSFNESVVTNKLFQIMKSRAWLRLPHSLSSLEVYMYDDNLDMSPLCVSAGEKCSYVDILCTDTCENPLPLLSEEATLVFQFQHPDVTSCDKPGKCGFVLKTVSGEGKLRKMKLCTEKEDYHDLPVHFHDQIRAENMHLYCVYSEGENKYLEPLSWLGWFNTERCSSHGDLDDWNDYYYDGTFRVLYKI